MELFDSVNTPLLLTQWKAYSPIKKIKDFIEVLAAHPNFEGKHYLLALSQTHLKELSASKLPPEFILGAKSIDSVKEGTFTETIAAAILKKVGANFVLVGSHESRQVLGDSNENINKKIHRLLAEKIQPVLCIGETLKEAQLGHPIDFLTAQIKNGLEGLTNDQIGQMVIFYEAPWLLTTPKKLTLDDTLIAHEACRQALHKALGNVLPEKMRVIYALPVEAIDLSGLVKHTDGASFYSATPDDILPLLDLITVPSSTSSEHDADAHKATIFSEVLPSEKGPSIFEHASNQPQTQLPIEQVSSSAETKEEEVVIKKSAKEQVPAAVEETEIKKIEAEGIEIGTGSKNIRGKSEPKKEAPSLTNEIAPTLQAEKVGESHEAVEILTKPQESEKVEEAVLEALEKTVLSLEKVLPLEIQKVEEKTTRTDLSAEDPRPVISAINRDKEGQEAKATPMKEDAAANSDESLMSEEVIEAHLPPLEDKRVEPPMPQQPSKTEGHVDFQEKIEVLQARADSLLKANEALGECYKKIKDLSERLPYLRTQFPDLLSKMTADLNKLDPFLQEKINTGNVSYFSENPDKAKEASVVLGQLQNLSQLFQETASIPRDVDRLQSKSRELRKDLETEWTYFRINKRKIKEKFPDFSFPAHPSQLLVSEPVVDLTPKDSPPATLGAKRFAVVKAPPIKK
ncbi:MAG: triose-phosphate isomerase [Parachlamydiaceae bacterium]|nr:triose-phosphate isomerase [Parachlamydiaceae bacterium]